MQRSVLGLAVLLVAIAPAMVAAQTARLRSAPAHDAQQPLILSPVPATSEASIALTLRPEQADPGKRGELWLQIQAVSSADPGNRLALRIPLSSTEDVYGESRSCTATPGGGHILTFTAGMDENNFVRFASSGKDQRLELLLNKYLCRAFAAPFRCGAAPVSLAADWSDWKIATAASLLLSADLPASISASGIQIKFSGKSFDPAQCAVIAPSNGLCCVQGKTTEWHCGGTPAGPGWHQVSGECFHRETGGTCDEKTVFPPLVSLP